MHNSSTRYPPGHPRVKTRAAAQTRAAATLRCRRASWSSRWGRYPRCARGSPSPAATRRRRVCRTTDRRRSPPVAAWPVVGDGVGVGAADHGDAAETHAGGGAEVLHHPRLPRIITTSASGTSSWTRTDHGGFMIDRAQLVPTSGSSSIGLPVRRPWRDSSREPNRRAVGAGLLGVQRVHSGSSFQWPGLGVPRPWPGATPILSNNFTVIGQNQPFGR